MICFYRATRMHSADYAVARCLCSYPSGTHQHCVETAEHIIKLFSPPGGHTILVFPYQTFWQYSDGNVGTSNAGGMKKVAIFDQCLALSRKPYKIGP